VTEVDFTGAMYVKREEAAGEYKVYICVMRAIDLEIVNDLTEATFLQAFRRFAARRSLSHLVLSDNTSTYISATKELNELFATMKTAFIHRGTTW